MKEKVELKQFIADLKKKLSERKKETRLRKEKMALRLNQIDEFIDQKAATRVIRMQRRSTLALEPKSHKLEKLDKFQPASKRKRNFRKSHSSVESVSGSESILFSSSN